MALRTPPKYPRTPYWPHSPSRGAGERFADASHFVGGPIVITEKLDGSCTLLHQGAVYARSVDSPTSAKWMAMVKKHHSWKVNEPDRFLYGEDIYGVHSIEYGPVPENETFYAFALRDGQGLFSSFGALADYASQRDIPVVPVLFAGTFHTEDDLRDFIHSSHAQASALGGEREGVVIRLARSFPASEFSNCVCKSVRAGHVQTTSTGPGTGDPAGSSDRVEASRSPTASSLLRDRRGEGPRELSASDSPCPFMRRHRTGAQPTAASAGRPLIRKARAVPGPLPPPVPQQAALADVAAPLRSATPTPPARTG